MSSKKLARIANFLKYWKNCVLFMGYNERGVLCVCMRRGDVCKEVPNTWELICDNGPKMAWNVIKNFLGESSFAYEYKSEQLIYSGFFD